MGTVADGRACRRGKRGFADEPVARRADDDDGIDRAGVAGTVAAAFRVGGAGRSDGSGSGSGSGSEREPAGAGDPAGVGS